MIDTHCHINFEGYDDDREAVLQRSFAAGVTRVIIPAVDVETSHEIVSLVTTHDGLYGAVGIHPNDTADFDEAVISEIEKLAGQAKIVSIGEIGLDYYWDKSPKEKQFAAFEAQLALAARLELPVIIHNRQANEDVMSILETWAKGLTGSLKERPGVMHSFSGTQAIAERALASGFYLGFTGPITYKNADETRRIAAAVPLDRLLVETDGPFLTPVPHRGKRNEPAYIPLIIERLAGIKLSTPEEIARITTENAIRLFQLN